MSSSASRRREPADPGAARGYRPMDSRIESALARAVTLHREGSLADAAALYAEILETDSQHADSLHLLGVVETQLGRPLEGVRLIERSLSISRRQPLALANLGNALLALGRPAEALAHYARALELLPRHPQALFGSGNACCALGSFEEAAGFFERAVELAPGLVRAHLGRASALLALKSHGEAARCIERALELEPACAEAFAERGHLLADLGQLDASIGAYDRALELDPRLTTALLSRGIAYSLSARFAPAVASFKQLEAIDPRYPYARGLCLHSQLQIADWTDYHPAVGDVIERVQRNEPADFPFSFLAVCDAPALQLRCARQFAGLDLRRPSPLWSSEPYTHERVRVAYVGADFLEHPTSYLLAGVLEKHDRDRFEVTALSLREDARSPMRHRIERAVERFIAPGACPDAQLARMIRALEIDIAVDLMGYTAEHRAGIFKYRAAPVQVSYLGYPGSTGGAEIDYIIADEFLIPEERRADYSEHIAYLPDCFQANDDGRLIDPVRPARGDMGLPDSAFVWCSMHSSYKLNPPLFDIWARLLRAVPGSVLWLIGREGVLEENLRREADARGVDPRRLIFARSLPYPKHLARLSLADLYLDTVPFNGGATTSDALWTGVPVLTCAGSSFAARMSGSLLHTVGLPELVTGSLEEYARKALELALTPERLRRIRDALARNARSSPLFCTDRFRRHLEAAYIEMAGRSRRGERAGTFKVLPEGGASGRR